MRHRRVERQVLGHVYVERQRRHVGNATGMETEIVAVTDAGVEGSLTVPVHMSMPVPVAIVRCVTKAPDTL